MKILHICILFFVVLFGGVGCHAPQKTSINSEQQMDGSNAEDLDRSEASCMDNANNIGWRMVDVDASNTEEMLRVKIFKVDNSALHKLFTKNISSTEAFQLSLPFSDNDQVICLQFEIQPSRELSYEKQKQHGVFKFTGLDVSNGANTLSIDYDVKNGMKATAHINGEWRILQSIEYSGGTYHAHYLAYNQQDMTILKSIFDIRE